VRILFVHASAGWSTADVGRGYAAALTRAGHELYEWRFDQRIGYVGRALELEPTPSNLYEVVRHASRMIATEAVDFGPDLVVVTSGLCFHPAGLVLLKKMGLPIAVILTESPYNEEDEAYFASFCDFVATNDRGSAARRGWTYLAPCYDPAVHVPGPPVGQGHDVVFIGTAWVERARRFASMDWTGIDFGLYGLWPKPADVDVGLIPNAGTTPISSEDEPFYIEVEKYARLAPYIRTGLTSPDETVRLYRASKLCINEHREHPLAESLGPRVYETLAVGGALLLTTYRPEIEDLLGPRWAEYVYDGTEDLEAKIRFYLKHDQIRTELVGIGRARVDGHTFDERVVGLLGLVAHGVRVGISA
jgi:hypothetical protein